MFCDISDDACQLERVCSPRKFGAWIFCLVSLSMISLVMVYSFPVFASAATWPVPASRLSATVGFHDVYTAGDKSYAHSGIDVAASAGLQISTPVAGKVRYTGAVPSGDSRVGESGSSGPTMNAVSVEMTDGRVVTLMPFAQIQVHEGDYVKEGRALGTLAGSGDISSSGPHLHMGLKRGSRYYDPMCLFGLSSTSAADKQVQPNTDSPYALSAHDGSSGQAEVPLAAEEAAVPAVDAAPDFGTISSNEEAVLDQELETSDLLRNLLHIFEPLAQSCTIQAEALLAVFISVSQATGIPVLLLITLAVLVLVAAVALLLVAAVKVLVPHAQRLWRSKTSPLLNGKVDDMLP